MGNNKKSMIADLKTVEKYTRAGFWKNRTLCDFLSDILNKFPEKIAIVDREKQLSFRDIDRLSNRLVRSLRKLGIRRGDVVSFIIPNWYQAAILNVAFSKLGTVVNPIIPIYKEREVKFILHQAKSKALFIPSIYRNFDYIEMIVNIRSDLPDLNHIVVVGENASDGMVPFDALLEEDDSPCSEERVDPNDVKLLIYTSGTTATPKGVQHTHNTLVCTALNDTSFMGLDENSVVFMPSPVTHITGYAHALEYPFIVGLRTVLMDKWDPEKALNIIEKERCTYSIGATPFLQQMVHSASLKDRRIIPGFKFLCGGAYIPAELIHDAWDAGWKTYRVYGSTESPTVTLGKGSMEQAANTDGIVVNYDVKVVGPHNEPLGFQEEGEIVVRGPKLFVGYKDSSLNEEAFDSNGWFHTGDLGKLSESEYIQITGRKKDIIIRGGENLSAAEIEDVLHLHPSIDTAAAVAMPDEKMGEKVCAYVLLKEGESLTFQQMIDFLSAKRLTKQKWPERLEIIDVFPMTASGKIKKHILREDIAHKVGLPPVR